MLADVGYEMREVRFILLSVLYIVTVFSPAISSAREETGGKIVVYAVNYPLKYFAERIAGEHAAVLFPVPADQDPAYWMPDVKTISEYQHADLILLNGASYAKWVNKVTLPRIRLVNTSAGFKERYIETAEVVTHSHGADAKHGHEALAFTTWIDFDLAAKQAEAIANALSRRKPALRSTFEANYSNLERDLLTLDKNIKAIVSNNQRQPLVASHPVYDYFSRRYGLNIKSVHWEPDEIPTAAQMVELRNILKDHPATWMIWEGEPKTVSVKMLKSMGMDSLVFDPCGNVPDQGDFLSVMRQNVESLEAAFTNRGQL
jgi:zinc transport system substrate-binding protein